MTASAWTPTNSARTNILNGTFNIASDSFKCALFSSTSNLSAASTTFAAVTNEVTTANGYTSGGVSVTFSLSGSTLVSVSFTSNPTWTPSGGNIVARYAVIYEVSGNVLCFCYLDSTPADVTTTPGNNLVLDSDGSPGPVFYLS